MYRLEHFAIHGDHAGSLVALEKGLDFSFDIKRIYYIWGTVRDAIRGRHAHRNLKQVIICLAGSCDFTLDDGRERVTYHLDSPSTGLYVENFVWREFTNFSQGCIVMVLASEHYDTTDYIRSYEEFMELCKSDSQSF
ncbi:MULTISPECIES: FdtA/QdtA family cupin domain-containing protein [unclassified Desulfovibrio]|uniref:sugar 3,4-ketoisomerase n=1 Tax=unclassified Desulfovibrio TaxID=2593640 RepID=UPI0013EA22C5|nr:MULTISPECIES: FdtA/QdtA family cupin domain-containing protein [unclassified Desulfovibrio]